MASSLLKLHHLARRRRRRGGSSIASPISSFASRLQSTLAFEKFVAGDDPARLKTAVAIHGLMGAGKNLRSLARSLASTVVQLSPRNSPGWQMILVDLRNHGNSAALPGFDPPHDIAAAAKDIAELVQSEPWGWPDVVMGHSLGGKIAMDFVKSCADGRYGDSAVPPKQLYVLDSVPGEVDDTVVGDVERLLDFIQSLPNPLPSRRWLLEEMSKHGFSKMLSGWLGSNLKQIDNSSEKMTWIFDINGVCDMYTSYRQSSYWSLLEYPPKGTEINLVRAERSDRWSPALLSKLESVVATGCQQRENCGILSYHVLRQAGHWLHVDNPNGLLEILVPSLMKLSSQSTTG